MKQTHTLKGTDQLSRVFFRVSAYSEHGSHRFVSNLGDRPDRLVSFWFLLKTFFLPSRSATCYSDTYMYPAN